MSLDVDWKENFPMEKQKTQNLKKNPNRTNNNSYKNGEKKACYYQNFKNQISIYLAREVEALDLHFYFFFFYEKQIF